MKSSMRKRLMMSLWAVIAITAGVLLVTVDLTGYGRTVLFGSSVFVGMSVWIALSDRMPVWFRVLSPVALLTLPVLALVGFFGSLVYPVPDQVQKVAQEYYTDKIIIGNDCRTDKDIYGTQLPAETKVYAFEQTCQILISTKGRHVTAGPFVDSRFSIVRSDDRTWVKIEIPRNYSFGVYVMDMGAPHREPLPDRDTSLYEYQPATDASLV